MKKRKRSSDRWLVTYSDVITLLLVFFVTLLSTVKVQPSVIKIILSQFSGNISYLNAGTSLEETESTFFTLGNVTQSLPAERKRKRIKKSSSSAQISFTKEIKSKRIRFVENEEGIVISLFTDIFFEKQSAKLNYISIKEILEKIRALIDNQNFQGQIAINGHTDNVPYQGSEFKNNWELSVQRSLQVFYALNKIPYIYPLDNNKLSVHGYGDSKPLESNDTIEGRAYNRRVDIVIKR